MVEGGRVLDVFVVLIVLVVDSGWSVNSARGSIAVWSTAFGSIASRLDNDLVGIDIKNTAVGYCCPKYRCWKSCPARYGRSQRRIH